MSAMPSGTRDMTGGGAIEVLNCGGGELAGTGAYAEKSGAICCVAQAETHREIWKAGCFDSALTSCAQPDPFLRGSLRTTAEGSSALPSVTLLDQTIPAGPYGRTLRARKWTSREPGAPRSGMRPVRPCASAHRDRSGTRHSRHRRASTAARSADSPAAR